MHFKNKLFGRFQFCFLCLPLPLSVMNLICWLAYFFSDIKLYWRICYKITKKKSSQRMALLSKLVSSLRKDKTHCNSLHIVLLFILVLVYLLSCEKMFPSLFLEQFFTWTHFQMQVQPTEQCCHHKAFVYSVLI